ncbi:MAG: methyltransferase domain-containing protein [Gemmataceae bacterium]
MSETAANVYDQVLYPSYPLPQADPRRLETLAVLHGLPAAPAQQCRVLEVGCGTGMNLLALAAFLPGSQFVGVDLAEQPIHIGQA